MKDELRGKAHKFADDINTDYIIAGKYTKTLDFSSLAQHLFEDIAPGFSDKVAPGDFVVAGLNFGCGSSREQAPIAIKYAGIGAVLAKSYSRIFFRNSINQGIPSFICDTDKILEGDLLALRPQKSVVEVPARDLAIPLAPLSSVMLDILGEGGLVEYLKKHRSFVLKNKA